jgi:hypothetical protein
MCRVGGWRRRSLSDEGRGVWEELWSGRRRGLAWELNDLPGEGYRLGMRSSCRLLD